MVIDDDYRHAANAEAKDPLTKAVQSATAANCQQPSPENEPAVSPAIAKDTAVQIPPRGDQRDRKKPKNRLARKSPGTKDGTSQPVGDLVELARMLASLTQAEREALMALAQVLRSPAT